MLMFSLFTHTRMDTNVRKPWGLRHRKMRLRSKIKTGHSASQGHSTTLGARQRIANVNSDLINRASDAKMWPWPMDGNVLHAPHETRRLTQTCYDLAHIRRAGA